MTTESNSKSVLINSIDDHTMKDQQSVKTEQQYTKTMK